MTNTATNDGCTVLGVLLQGPRAVVAPVTAHARTGKRGVVEIVGMPEEQAARTAERVEWALQDDGWARPAGRVTVVVPAGERGWSPALDLALVLSVLETTGQLEGAATEGVLAAGAVAGRRVVPTAGLFPAAVTARKEGLRLATAEGGAEHARWAGPVSMHAGATVREVVQSLGNEPDGLTPASRTEAAPDPDGIDAEPGWETLKNTLTIAVTGRHPAVIAGLGTEPIARLTRLAAQLPGPPDRRERAEILSAHSMAGLLASSQRIDAEAPFPGPAPHEQHRQHRRTRTPRLLGTGRSQPGPRRGPVPGGGRRVRPHHAGRRAEGHPDRAGGDPALPGAGTPGAGGRPVRPGRRERPAPAGGRDADAEARRHRRRTDERKGLLDPGRRPPQRARAAGPRPAARAVRRRPTERRHGRRLGEPPAGRGRKEVRIGTRVDPKDPTYDNIRRLDEGKRIWEPGLDMEGFLVTVEAADVAGSDNDMHHGATHAVTWRLPSGQETVHTLTTAESDQVRDSVTGELWDEAIEYLGTQSEETAGLPTDHPVRILSDAYRKRQNEGR